MMFADWLLATTKSLKSLFLLPLTAALVAFGITSIIPPTFTAETKFLPPQQQAGMAANLLQSLGTLGGLASSAAGLKNPLDQYVSFLRTNQVRDALIEKYDLVERFGVKLKTDARDPLAAATKITAGKDGIVVLEFEDKDPEFAAKVANAYVAELAELTSKFAITDAQQRRLFFEKQLAAVKIKLNDSEAKLKASGVSVETLNANPNAAIEGPSRLYTQIVGLEVRISSMRAYLTDEAPEMKRALSELAALRQQLTKAGDQRGRGSNSDDYINRYREYRYQESLFEAISKQAEVARLDESREGASIQVIDVARAPERKSKPRRLSIMVATFISVFFLVWISVIFRAYLVFWEKDPELGNKLRVMRSNIRRAFFLKDGAQP